jgi:hypothetical protein
MRAHGLRWTGSTSGEVQGEQPAVQRSCAACDAGVLGLLRQCEDGGCPRRRLPHLHWTRLVREQLGRTHLGWTQLASAKIRCRTEGFAGLHAGRRERLKQYRGAGSGEHRVNLRAGWDFVLRLTSDESGGENVAWHRKSRQSGRRAAGCRCYLFSASRMRAQVVSRSSGRTRVLAVTVIKLVSPIQRGRACMWMCAAMPAPPASPRLRPKFIPAGR